MGVLLKLVERSNEKTAGILRALAALAAKRAVADVMVLYTSSDGEHFVCSGRYERPAEAVNALVRMELQLAREQDQGAGRD